MNTDKRFKNINQLFKFERLNHGYTFQSLTEILQTKYEIKLSKTTLFRIENDGFPVNASVLYTLCDFYDINLNSLKPYLILKR